MTEEWRDIAGYEGLYKVSNKGEVMRMAQDIIGKYGDVYHKPEHLLKQSQGGKGASEGKGYLQVNLFRGGKMRAHRIHRLVAGAFIPNPFLLPQVNHIDGNKLNNCVDNLEWCDAHHNVRHAYAAGLMKGKNGESNGSHKLSQDAVDFIRSVYEPRTVRLGAQAFGKAFGVNRHTIERIAEGKSWKVDNSKLVEEE